MSHWIECDACGKRILNALLVQVRVGNNILFEACADCEARVHEVLAGLAKSSEVRDSILRHKPTVVHG